MNKKEKKIRNLVASLPDSYDNLIEATANLAKRSGEYDRIIDYLEKNSPTCSELVLFFEEIEPLEE